MALPKDPMTLRKDLLRMVLRNTLQEAGIPTEWVGAEVLIAVAQDGSRGGMHVRLLVRHWDPRLLTHGYAFQNKYRRAVLELDPKAQNWFIGSSWQFDLADTTACPALPPPHAWRMAPGEASNLLDADDDLEADFRPAFVPTMPAGHGTRPAPL